MSPKLTDLEKRVILALQRDLEISPRPFLPLACQLDLSEEEFLAAVQGLVAQGYIRRFGATLRHQLSGFEANALVTWIVPEGDLRRVGEALARHREVTHCYHREPTPDWPYNLYSMIHAKSPEEIVVLAASLARDIDVPDYEILFSDVELKKTTMRYFREQNPD